MKEKINWFAVYILIFWIFQTALMLAFSDNLFQWVLIPVVSAMLIYIYVMAFEIIKWIYEDLQMEFGNFAFRKWVKSIFITDEKSEGQ